MSLPLPAEPHTQVEWLRLTDVPLAVVRHSSVTLDGLEPLFDASYGALGQAIAAGRIRPAGPAIAFYRGDPNGPLELSIGFPVAQPLGEPLDEGGTRIEHDQLPGGAWAATSHVGGYDGLGAAWAGLLEKVEEGGARPAGEWAEVYVTEPSPQADPATMRTDLFVATVLDEIL